jgi:hypothetical protein
MRVFACISLASLLAVIACSGSEDGSRGASGGASGAAGAGLAAGSSPVAQGGAAVSFAGNSATAGTTAAAGAPITSAGSPGQGGAPPSSNGDVGAHVITWVPPYHIAESKQQLSASFDGTTMADGLSFLALQFWMTEGPSATLHQVTEADVSWFYDWAQQHGVKIFLCVHNNTGDWNWPEAVRSFRENRDAFAQNLASQVASRGFDGVDLDLEGIVDATTDEQQAYQQFVQTLGNALHPTGKLLTLDSFYGKWNAPNYNWWPALLPLVDGITSMGYEQSGMDVDYQDLVDHAAAAPQKLMIGVPSYQGTWLNHTVTEQLGWLVQQGQVGTAIWDASLSAPEWRQRSVWEQLKSIKAR